MSKERTQPHNFTQQNGQPKMNAEFFRLQGLATEIIVEATIGGRPQILYWGPLLEYASPNDIASLSVRQWAHGGTAIDIQASLSNEFGAGLTGPSGFVAHREGKDWATIFRVTSVDKTSDYSIRITCEDCNTKVRAAYFISINPYTDVITSRIRIENTSDYPLFIDWCAAICFPLDYRFVNLMTFTGRWAQEFQTQDVPRARGSYVRENKSGRTSHDNFPGIVAAAKSTSENLGPCAGFHLGWSGNHRLRVDSHSDGRSFLQMGELFLPGEMVLACGEQYETPALYAAWSESGLNTLSQRFHSHVLNSVMDKRIASKPRPVHFNTWEAIYFDQSEDKVLDLAEKAASVGAERFVLDDGWFGGRRNDAAGLGDWRVSKDVYPQGLGRIADRIRELGMEFGLWFEPEMVNPDSELYRLHPDWILEAKGVEQVPFRNQYALDLTRPDVVDYLFESISAIVEEYAVAYIKWDMNRDIHHPGSAGRSAIHSQTHSVYSLIEKLRRRFPQLEIESCSSGGARADYGILSRTDRLWLSDSNDAGDRQQIQRGASYFFPLAVSGAHIGPKTCHITRRVYNMEYRAATALFGHMGIELNLDEESPEDLQILAAAVNLYKKHRSLIHTGDYSRLEHSDYLNVAGVVSKDKSEAIFSCAKTKGHGATLPDRLRFAGFEPAKEYLMRIIWPTKDISITAPSIIETANLLGAGLTVSGEALLTHGVQLPLMYPDSCIIYHFQSL
ncbi:MAG: alpha-galactosidase [Pseudomonadota bacterium]